MTKINVKLKLNGGLKKDDRINDLIGQCEMQIKLIHGWEDMKLNQSITYAVMKSVYKECKKIGSGLDKEEIVVTSLTNAYKLEDEDIAKVKKDIKYIIDQGFNQGFFLKQFRRAVKVVKSVINFLN